MATHHQLDDDVEGYANLAVQLAMAKEEQREAAREGRRQGRRTPRPALC